MISAYCPTPNLARPLPDLRIDKKRKNIAMLPNLPNLNSSSSSSSSVVYSRDGAHTYSAYSKRKRREGWAVGQAHGIAGKSAGQHAFEWLGVGQSVEFIKKIGETRFVRLGMSGKEHTRQESCQLLGSKNKLTSFGSSARLSFMSEQMKCPQCGDMDRMCCDCTGDMRTPHTPCRSAYCQNCGWGGAYPVKEKEDVEKLMDRLKTATDRLHNTIAKIDAMPYTISFMRTRGCLLSEPFRGTTISAANNGDHTDD